jgi:putative transposase
MPKQEHLIEVTLASKLSRIPVRTIRHRIMVGKLAAEIVPSRGGRNGHKYLIPLSSLPPSAQAEYLKQNGILPNPKTCKVAPVSVSPTYQAALPEWAEKDALAKADLLAAWHKEKNSFSSVGDALNRFLFSYNTGLLLPEVFHALGCISRGTLYRWEKAYAESNNDYRALAPEWGNRGGKTKISDEERNVLLSILLQQNRIKVGTAINITKHILARRGIASPSSPNTMRRFIKSFVKLHYDLWVALREGEKALNDKVLPFLKRDSSLLNVGDVLVADGHRLNFQVINPYTGRPCRAVLVGFYDWASRDLLGYEIMVEENIQAVAAALRNAVIELGKIPKAVLIDNGKAFKAKVFTSDLSFEECGFYGMFARLGIITSFAWPYNAQSKPIERFFGTFSDSFERFMPSFIGSTIEDKPGYMRRNEKFLKSLHNDWVPTIQEAMAMIAQWRAYYRTLPHRGLNGRTPGDVLATGKGQGINVRELDYLMLSVETASIGRNGIRFLGNEYFHESLYGLRDKVIIRYSFFDLSQIFVFSTRGEYLCAASIVKSVHPMASLTGNPVTMDAVKEGIRRKRTLKRQTLKVVTMAKEACKDVVLPWHDIVPSIPRIAEHIESIDAGRRAELQSLPAMITLEDGEAAFATVEMKGPKTYRHAFEKYEDLISKDKLTTEEIVWIEEFKKSDQYKYSYA